MYPVTRCDPCDPCNLIPYRPHVPVCPPSLHLDSEDALSAYRKKLDTDLAITKVQADRDITLARIDYNRQYDLASLESKTRRTEAFFAMASHVGGIAIAGMDRSGCRSMTVSHKEWRGWFSSGQSVTFEMR